MRRSVSFVLAAVLLAWAGSAWAASVYIYDEGSRKAEISGDYIYVNGSRVGEVSGSYVYRSGSRVGEFSGSYVYKEGSRHAELSGNYLYIDGSRRWEFSGDYAYLDGSRKLEVSGLSSDATVKKMVIAYILFFRIIEKAGPSEALTVTFLVPVFALMYGVFFLSESITPWMVTCGVIIVCGTALSSGLVRLGRLEQAT
jgi:hypothetical protein